MTSNVQYHARRWRYDAVSRHIIILVSVVRIALQIALLNQGFNAALDEGYGGLETTLGLCNDILDEVYVFTSLARFHNTHDGSLGKEPSILLHLLLHLLHFLLRRKYTKLPGT